MQRSQGEGEHELARTRFNRYFPLVSLGRFDEAQRILESCLQAFREEDDLMRQAQALSALSSLWDRRGDSEQAAALDRQALAARNRLPDLADRAISHGNLSNNLDRLEEGPEAAPHLLAAIVYDLAIDHRQLLETHRSNLALRVRRAAAGGERYELPRLADLLARPEFEALRETLADRGIDLGELQGYYARHGGTG